MKTMTIIIRRNGVMVLTPKATEFIDGVNMVLFVKKMADFLISTKESFTAVNFFVAEDLLFFKSFELPLATPDLKEAISYQLGTLVPFPNDSFLYSFSSLRKKSGYRISLYGVQRQLVEKYLRALSDAGYTISGIFPESQRYVNRSCPKGSWALLMPGLSAKLFIFSKNTLTDRSLCNVEPSFSELTEYCHTDIIYHPEPALMNGTLDAAKLLEKKPRLKAFNMLPVSYRQPEYCKMIVVGLLVLNLVGAFGLMGLKLHHVQSTEARLDVEINAIMPKVAEMDVLRQQEKNMIEAIDRMKDIGGNQSLIDLLANLTKYIPASSHLDQIRKHRKTGVIHLQGYTDNISELTSGLQMVGNVTLKATSRRQNQTYFQLEIFQP